MGKLPVCCVLSYLLVIFVCGISYAGDIKSVEHHQIGTALETRFWNLWETSEFTVGSPPGKISTSTVYYSVCHKDPNQ
ncbi:MAG TPA: hypothetical protein VEL47_02440 [Myxococcota bacterium]|nr:hypothetical protein [Myxococcota bacterium]